MNPAIRKSRDARRIIQSSTILLVALGAFTSLVFALHHRPVPDGAMVLSHASTDVFGDVALPHDWRAEPERTQQARYHFSFDAVGHAPDRPIALYLSSLHHNAVITLNGNHIGNAGRLDAPIARNHNQPRLFELPEQMLLEANNKLLITLISDPPGTGFIPAPLVGPMAILLPHYEQRLWLRVRSMQIITIAILAVCAVMMTLWYFRPEETMYLWFSVTAGFWLVYLLNYLVVEPPISAQLWVVIVRFGALGWFVLSIVIFINRFLGQRQPRYELCLAAVYTILPACLLIPDFETASYLGVRFFTPLVWLLGLDPAIKMTRAVWGRSDQEIIWLTCSGLAILILGVHDILMNSGIVSREHGYFLIYAPPITVVVFTGMLVRRFVRALQASEILNRELEQRVADKVAEAHDAYAKLSEVERDRALQAERERIMRDMHDGVGGHLVSTLYLVQRGQYSPDDVQAAIRNALTDLRLMIDSMESPDGELPLALANLRSRITPQLTKAGIAIRWNVNNNIDKTMLGPAATLQVMRVVQEAITNAVKHADAQTIELYCAQDLGEITVEIRDDGCGLGSKNSNQPGGRGLGNMRQRAEQIGARLDVLEAEPGTRVRLVIPIA